MSDEMIDMTLFILAFILGYSNAISRIIKKVRERR
jgi:hypothetical protein